MSAVPYTKSGEPIIIRRGDVERLLDFPERTRDKLILALPAKMGFRPSEVTMLRKRHVDLDGGCIYVRDSKKSAVAHKDKLFPIPMPYEVAKLIQECISPKHSLVVRRLAHTRGYNKSIETPLTIEEIYHVTKRLAAKAGVPNWTSVNTTLLRHYFAATWVYDQKGSVETLRRIMRHKSLAYTQFYLARLVFFEDLKQEVDRLHEIPNLKEESKKQMFSPDELNDSPFCEQWCSHCAHDGVCKYKPEAAAAFPWASGCRRFMDVTRLKEVFTEIEQQPR